MQESGSVELSSAASRSRCSVYETPLSRSDSPVRFPHRSSATGKEFIPTELCELCGLRGVEFLMKRPLSYLTGNYLCPEIRV
ncbi:hypothetical protein AAHA92_30810 [Salvia divinorum]|uniref:Uncharacterized protein n=1 Tax=Salvia divinorum TaxID=28513 RepID=A0ABD1FUH6_SALDI